MMMFCTGRSHSPDHPVFDGETWNLPEVAEIR